MFGENLTTEGLLDHEVRVGDIFQMGSAKLQAIQPRIPCFKLNLRFQQGDMLSRFRAAAKFGIYFKIIEAGSLQKADPITLIQRGNQDLTIQQISDCFLNKGADLKLTKQITNHDLLPDSLRKVFRSFIK